MKTIWSRLSKIAWGIAVLALLSGLVWVYFDITQDMPGPRKVIPLIRVMTYSSFFMPEGPGPVIKAEYEKRFGGEIEFVEGGDSALMVERLKTLPEKQIDLVLGISLLHYQRALRELNWQKNIFLGDWQVVPELQFLRKMVADNEFRIVPYSWSPMTFVFRQGQVTPPTSWQDLERPEYLHSATSQDPRFSMPGNFLAFWAWNSAEKDFSPSRINQLRNILFPLSPSWSVSYGMFRKGHAKMTFTYATSPFYHRIVDHDSSYQAAIFSEPHPYEVEWAAIPIHCVSCEEAKKLVQFLLDPMVQKILMEKNFMLPVIAGVKDQSPFAELPQYPLISWEDLAPFGENQAEWAKKFVDLLTQKESQ